MSRSGKRFFVSSACNSLTAICTAEHFVECLYVQWRICAKAFRMKQNHTAGIDKRSKLTSAAAEPESRQIFVRQAMYPPSSLGRMTGNSMTAAAFSATRRQVVSKGAPAVSASTKAEQPTIIKRGSAAHAKVPVYPSLPVQASHHHDHALLMSSAFSQPASVLPPNFLAMQLQHSYFHSVSDFPARTGSVALAHLSEQSSRVQRPSHSQNSQNTVSRSIEHLNRTSDNAETELSATLSDHLQPSTASRLQAAARLHKPSTAVPSPSPSPELPEPAVAERPCSSPVLGQSPPVEPEPPKTILQSLLASASPPPLLSRTFASVLMQPTAVRPQPKVSPPPAPAPIAPPAISISLPEQTSITTLPADLIVTPRTTPIAPIAAINPIKPLASIPSPFQRARVTTQPHIPLSPPKASPFARLRAVTESYEPVSGDDKLLEERIVQAALNADFNASNGARLAPKSVIGRPIASVTPSASGSIVVHQELFADTKQTRLRFLPDNLPEEAHNHSPHSDAQPSKSILKATSWTAPPPTTAQPPKSAVNFCKPRVSATGEILTEAPAVVARTNRAPKSVWQSSLLARIATHQLHPSPVISPVPALPTPMNLSISVDALQASPPVSSRRPRSPPPPIASAAIAKLMQSADDDDPTESSTNGSPVKRISIADLSTSNQSVSAAPAPLIQPKKPFGTATTAFINSSPARPIAVISAPSQASTWPGPPRPPAIAVTPKFGVPVARPLSFASAAASNSVAPTKPSVFDIMRSTQ